jgi:pyroglutamyl-peptidase
MCLANILNIPAERGLKRRLKMGRGPAPRLRLAITGFGPFPGVPFNASERLIAELAATPLRMAPAPVLSAASLPTDWHQALPLLRRLIGEMRPHVLVHFGVSARAQGFVIETRAVNQTSRRMDVSGALAGARCVRGSARAALSANLPAGRIIRRLRLEGIPATVSSDAGRYLCNAVLFESLMLAEAAAGTPLVGFIHIPALPRPEESAALPNGFGWDELRRGSAVILDTMLRAYRH